MKTGNAPSKTTECYTEQLKLMVKCWVYMCTGWGIGWYLKLEHPYLTWSNTLSSPTAHRCLFPGNSACGRWKKYPTMASSWDRITTPDPPPWGPGGAEFTPWGMGPPWTGCGGMGWFCRWIPDMGPVRVWPFVEFGSIVVSVQNFQPSAMVGLDSFTSSVRTQLIHYSCNDKMVGTVTVAARQDTIETKELPFPFDII